MTLEAINEALPTNVRATRIDERKNGMLRIFLARADGRPGSREVSSSLSIADALAVILPPIREWAEHGA